MIFLVLILFVLHQVIDLPRYYLGVRSEVLQYFFPNVLFVTTFLNYSYSPTDLKYQHIYILNSQMYLSLSVGSLFSTNIFVISCTFSVMSFSISRNFSTYKMSYCWVKLVLSHLSVYSELAILTPLLFHISFVSFCQILQKILLVLG